ncbi:MAG: N-acetyltransferase family protein [Gemmataceae bacterium]
MSYLVREALESDVQTIVEFNRLLAWETEEKSLDRDRLFSGVCAVIRNPARGKYYLAGENSDVFGQLMITTEWSDWRNGWFWWIQSVYVREHARKKGVFRLLYEHVIQLAQRQGDVVGIRLYVERENQKAQATYYRLGMTTTSYLLLEKCPI